MTGIDHQPLKIRFINYFSQQLFQTPRSANGRTGDGYSSSPRNLGAGPAKVRRCVISKIPHSKTGDYRRQVYQPYPVLQVNGVLNVSKPDLIGRDDDVMLTCHDLISFLRSVAMQQFLDLTTLSGRRVVASSMGLMAGDGRCFGPTILTRPPEYIRMRGMAGRKACDPKPWVIYFPVIWKSLARYLATT